MDSRPILLTLCRPNGSEIYEIPISVWNVNLHPLKIQLEQGDCKNLKQNVFLVDEAFKSNRILLIYEEGTNTSLFVDPAKYSRVVFISADDE